MRSSDLIGYLCADCGDAADDGGEGDDYASLAQPRPPALFRGLLLGAGAGGVPAGDGVVVALHGTWLPTTLAFAP